MLTVSTRKLIAPEVLFLAGFIQAFLPYVLWIFDSPLLDYEYSITFIPLLVWCCGYVSFISGCRIESFGIDNKKHSYYKVNSAEVNFIFWILVLVSVACFFYSIGLYGGIPLLEYFSESNTVEFVNLTQLNSLGGILGLNVATLILLGGIVSVLLVRQRQFTKSTVFLWMVVLFLSLAHSMAGKRQGLAILFISILIASMGTGRHPIEILPLPMLKRLSTSLKNVIFLGILAVFVALFGALGQLRTDRSKEHASLIRYLELPMVNFEHQAAVVGFGPYKFDLIKCFHAFLPYKLANLIFIDETSDTPKLEKSSPSGFWEVIHWNTGIYGVISFSVLFGWVSKHIYRKALRSDMYLMLYSFFGWALVASHTYNHFLNIAFIWLPIFCFIVLLFLARVLGAK
jgi:oligosaccharide repeat unit polymerase